MSDIRRQAERDLFGSHQTAAAKEAEKRYVSKFAPDCCHLISTDNFLTQIRKAFVEGVIWKEKCINEGIEGWVARDKSGRIALWRIEPYKEEACWGLPCEMGAWMKLDNSLFPSVKWDDDKPTKVRILIEEGGER